MKQLVDYIRRLDAIRIQRAFIDECFGERAIDDSEEDDDDNEEEEDDDEGEERVEVETAEEKLDPAYPRPTLSVAVWPTHPRLSGHDLITAYGATALIRSLTRFLKPLARDTGFNPVVLPSDTFDTWHKITFCHDVVTYPGKTHIFPYFSELSRCRLSQTPSHMIQLLPVTMRNSLQRHLS
ncbi:hypothetical protein FRC08_016800 [Ceratobasidium sp. 394]|nr:hypothetical protein FRC08_016800 [Ceratobasidium sp. 394]